MESCRHVKYQSSYRRTFWTYTQVIYRTDTLQNSTFIPQDHHYFRSWGNSFVVLIFTHSHIRVRIALLYESHVLHSRNLRCLPCHYDNPLSHPVTYTEMNCNAHDVYHLTDWWSEYRVQSEARSQQGPELLCQGIQGWRLSIQDRRLCDDNSNA